MSLLERLTQWYREWTHTELPCGCLAADGRGVRFSDSTTEINREHQVVSTTEHRHCTERNTRWLLTLECDQCGTQWQQHSSGGRTVDFGAENPDAATTLTIDSVPNVGGLMGRGISYTEEPIVDDELAE